VRQGANKVVFFLNCVNLFGIARRVRSVFST
jgi:hypothetical protein